MPIFTGSASKATPASGINYITNPNKSAIISSLSLDDSRNYAEQFKQTADLWRKAQKQDSRKYYHFKLSFAPTDNITAKQAHEIAEQHSRAFFSHNECVISTHTDKKHVHTHIIVNAVAFDTGKMLQVSPKQYGKMKEKANELAKKQGFSVVDFRKKAQVKLTAAEKQIQMRGGVSWKEDLREVLDLAKSKAQSMSNFVEILSQYNVEVCRNTSKTFSVRHPEQSKPIRGERLGAAYTKEAIQNVINEHQNRIDSERAIKQRALEQLERVKSNSEVDRSFGVRENTECSVAIRKLASTFRESRNAIQNDDSDRRNKKLDKQSRQREQNRTGKLEIDRRKQESEQRSNPVKPKINRSYNEER